MYIYLCKVEKNSNDWTKKQCQLPYSLLSSSLNTFRLTGLFSGNCRSKSYKCSRFFMSLAYDCKQIKKSNSKKRRNYNEQQTIKGRQWKRQHGGGNGEMTKRNEKKRGSRVILSNSPNTVAMLKAVQNYLPIWEEFASVSVRLARKCDLCVNGSWIHLRTIPEKEINQYL